MPTVEMKKLGDLFRNRREEMHLTLKEVENATSIRMSYLQAIEEGKVDQFLSRVYAIGFVRQYSTFLGFEADRIMQENPEAFKLPSEKQEFAYGIGTLDIRGGPHGGVKWLPNILWIGLGLFVLILAWYFAKFLGIV
jgi:cytoskeletal protein RodZ